MLGQPQPTARAISMTVACRVPAWVVKFARERSSRKLCVPPVPIGYPFHELIEDRVAKHRLTNQTEPV